MKYVKNSLKISVLFALGAVAQQAAASGYHFGTQSVNSQSTANAAAAEAADASTLFYNPAGLSKLDNQISVNANLVFPHIEYSEAQAKYFRGDAEVQGSDSGKITKNTLAPHVYGAYKINENTTLGLGVYVPFASSTEYQHDSKLRFSLNQLGLTAVAIEPALAFKVNEKYALAAGVVAQYAKADIRKYADWSASYPSTAIPVNPTQAASAANPTVAQAGGRAAFEGYAKVKGDDWGFGYHLAWLYDVNDRVRVGVNYRSKVTHSLEGEAEWIATGKMSQLLRGQFAQNGYKAKEGARTKIVTPESLSVHGMYRVNDKVNVFGDITWTRHSRFNQVDLYFENEKTVANRVKSNVTTIKPNWRDTFKVGLGGSYQYSDSLQLRAGVAFDQSPVRSADSRLNTLPDGNRIWWSAGFKYNVKQKHVIDVAYSHVHINDTRFTTTAASGNDVDSKGAASAKFKNYANIFGVQYTYKF